MWKDLFGVLASLIAIGSLVPYVRDAWLKRTRPHVFTWVIWTVTTFIVAAGQIVGGAGAGAWSTTTTAVICVGITALVFRHGERHITPLDWWCLVACAAAAVAWLITKGPLLSVVLVTLIDAVAYIPTLRKSWHKPFEETLSTHELSIVKGALSIAALSQITVTTALYPIVVVVMDIALVWLMITRRRDTSLR